MDSTVSRLQVIHVANTNLVEIRAWGGSRYMRRKAIMAEAEKVGGLRRENNRAWYIEHLPRFEPMTSILFEKVRKA